MVGGRCWFASGQLAGGSCPGKINGFRVSCKRRGRSEPRLLKRRRTTILYMHHVIRRDLEDAIVIIAYHNGNVFGIKSAVLREFPSFQNAFGIELL